MLKVEVPTATPGVTIEEESYKEIREMCVLLEVAYKVFYEKNPNSRNALIPFEAFLNVLTNLCVSSGIPEKMIHQAVERLYSHKSKQAALNPLSNNQKQ